MDYTSKEKTRKVQLIRDHQFCRDTVPKKPIICQFADSTSLIPFLGEKYCFAPIAPCKHFKGSLGSLDSVDMIAVREVNLTDTFSSSVNVFLPFFV